MSQKDRKVVVHCCVCVAPALMKEELSDVDDTASGTDWLMLNNQQYLMHCLQHRKKRRSSIYALRSVCHWCTHVVLLNRVMNKILSSDNVCVCVCVWSNLSLLHLSVCLCYLIHYVPLWFTSVQIGHLGVLRSHIGVLFSQANFPILIHFCTDVQMYCISQTSAFVTSVW